MEGGSVVVVSGRITRIGGPDVRVPDDAEVIDGRGRTLLPGLIDAHVHLTDSAAADLRQAASLGVTTVIDMFSAGTRFERIKQLRTADSAHLADVRTAGLGASAPGGHPSQMGGPPVEALPDSAQAAEFVLARAAEGADVIKIIYDDLSSFGRSVPMLSRGTLSALIATAT
jgi:predicted amidohydrolase YtcJ